MMATRNRARSMQWNLNTCLKAACEETVLAFFHALDTRRYEAAAALMTEDGCWERQGRLLSGREQILDALNGRAPDRATCHVDQSAAGHAGRIAGHGRLFPDRLRAGRRSRAGATAGRDPRMPGHAGGHRAGWRLQDKRSRHLPRNERRMSSLRH